MCFFEMKQEMREAKKICVFFIYLFKRWFWSSCEILLKTWNALILIGNISRFLLSRTHSLNSLLLILYKVFFFSTFIKLRFFILLEYKRILWDQDKIQETRLWRVFNVSVSVILCTFQTTLDTFEIGFFYIFKHFTHDTKLWKKYIWIKIIFQWWIIYWKEKLTKFNFLTHKWNYFCVQ
jgi:hypothetical protein